MPSASGESSSVSRMSVARPYARSSIAVPNSISASSSRYDAVEMPSSTMTSVWPPRRSMSSMSPRIWWTVTWSGVWMLYQTERLLRFCATTTSDDGTHCTYVQ